MWGFNKAVMSLGVILIVGLVLISVNPGADAAAAVMDDYERLSPEDMKEYIAELEAYLQMKQQASKRGRFCLRRDMTCPNLDNGKDFCCEGSQCSCNLFGQNCKCSTIGLFQRLGRR